MRRLSTKGVMRNRRLKREEDKKDVEEEGQERRN